MYEEYTHNLAKVSLFDIPSTDCNIELFLYIHSMCLSVILSFCLSVCISVYPSTHLPICPSVRSSVCRYFYFSDSPFLFRSLRLFFCRQCPSVCTFYTLIRKYFWFFSYFLLQPLNRYSIFFPKDVVEMLKCLLICILIRTDIAWI